MMRSHESGASTFELALVLPVLLLVVALVFPIVRAGWEYVVVSRATAAGVRYATRADENARVASPGGYLTRRPTWQEVDGFVRSAAQPVGLGAVSVSPEPAASLPGETVTLTVRYQMSLGPLASVANALTAAFFGGGSLLPSTRDVTVAARGRQE